MSSGYGSKIASRSVHQFTHRSSYQGSHTVDLIDLPQPVVAKRDKKEGEIQGCESIKKNPSTSNMNLTKILCTEEVVCSVYIDIGGEHDGQVPVLYN